MHNFIIYFILLLPVSVLIAIKYLYHAWRHGLYLIKTSVLNAAKKTTLKTSQLMLYFILFEENTSPRIIFDADSEFIRFKFAGPLL